MSVTTFVRTVKLRQHVFRDESGTVSNDGRNPRDKKGLRNPHLPALGHEKENLYPSIRGTGEPSSSSRSGKSNGRRVPEPGMTPVLKAQPEIWPVPRRPASTSCCPSPPSQELCRRLYGRWTRTFARWSASTTRAVSPPWSSSGFLTLGSPEGGVTRGAQNTSVDALLVAETVSGYRRAYLIEWKYAEQYQSTRPALKGDGRSGNVCLTSTIFAGPVASPRYVTEIANL